MSKQKEQYFIFCIILVCFLYPFLSEAKELEGTKVLPITSNSYRKNPTEVKKAVKKVLTPSNSSTDSKISNPGFSSLKTTTKTTTPSILSNSKVESTQKTTSSSDKSKVVAKSSIKVSQPNDKKEDKTGNIDNKQKATTKSSTKVSKPKNIKEEKTSRKDRISEPIIKVKLGGNHFNISVKVPEGGQITNSKGKKIKALKKGETFEWTSVIDKKAKKKKIDYLNETLTIKPTKETFIFNGNEYRGKAILKLTENGAIVINEISIEDYLRGVVGREIGSSSPDESLKAQSVIARTYAYAHKGRHGADGADVCNSTHCQVYFGKSAERDSVDKAIKNTRGYILTYNGNPISALYHATCGGMTSNNEEVWGGNPEPFLRRVICNFCVNGTKYRWNQELDVSKLRSALAKEGVKLGEVYNVSIEAPAKMDRVTNMVFQTNNGEQKIRGTTIRRLFDLPSTTFILGNKDEKANLIASAKAEMREEKPVVIPLKNNPSVVITGFSNAQHSPKQLLVYTSRGLKRAVIPSEGWRCISYNLITKRGIAFLSENEDNKNRSDSINSTKTLKTISISSRTKKDSKLITRINLFGRGFGHQVGMCQSGAVAMGKEGWNYRQILAHYYQGVALKKLGY